MESFSTLTTAAYCPRKLYYRRRHEDYAIPEGVEEIRSLAYRYDDLLDPGTTLTDEPIAVAPATYRSNLQGAKERLDYWPDVADPPETRVLLQGKDCRGIAHKLLCDRSIPVFVSAGEPPEHGVWKPHAVRATAAAKALAWEERKPVERALVEYPAYGRIRTVRLTTRRKAAYRRALEAVRSLDGPPPRLRNDPRCDACEYREECGTKTRSLRSLLSL